MKKVFYFALILIISCNSTRIVSSWCDPNKSVSINNLNKVLVVALFKDETSQRKAEDQMVSYLNGKGVVSYEYFKSNFNLNNEEAIRQKIKLDGFDGAVTMRLVDVDKEQVYTPGETSYYPVSYRSFSGYYYNRWVYNSTPGYYTTSKTYTIETNVYSIVSDKIIWSGLTETTDPSGLQSLTNEVAERVYHQMVKDGLIVK
jgi:hypothetical protein